MALERLVSDVRALNEELPQVTEKLRQAAEVAGTVAPDEGTFRASEAASKAAGEAARATKESNDAAAKAAVAIQAIEPVTIPSSVDIRINGGGGGAGGGLISGPTPLLGDTPDTPGGGILFDAAGNPIRRSAGAANRTTNTPGQRASRGISGGASLINPLEPTAGEALIASKLDALAGAIQESAMRSGTSIRMGAKS